SESERTSAASRVITRPPTSGSSARRRGDTGGGVHGSSAPGPPIQWARRGEQRAVQRDPVGAARLFVERGALAEDVAGRDVAERDLAPTLGVGGDAHPPRHQQVDVAVVGVARDNALASLVIPPNALPRQRIELLGRKPFEELDIAQAE